jgi:hypothetical protein
MGKKSKHRHAMKMRVFREMNYGKEIIYLRWRDFLGSRLVHSVDVDDYIPISYIPNLYVSVTNTYIPSSITYLPFVGTLLKID